MAGARHGLGIFKFNQNLAHIGSWKEGFPSGYGIIAMDEGSDTSGQKSYTPLAALVYHSSSRGSKPSLKRFRADSACHCLLMSDCLTAVKVAARASQKSQSFAFGQ